MSENNDAVSKEVGLADVLSTASSEEVFHDVTLKGNDGVGVGASRVILAVRSKVFQGMLLGKFNEGASGTVEINEHEGSVLKAVVECVRTDKPQILNEKKRKADKDSICDPEEIESLVSLAAAANFFDLPGLLEKASGFLSIVLEKSPCLSLVLLEFCKKNGPAVPGKLVDLAWSGVRSSSVVTAIGNDEAVACVSQETLEEILKDEETFLNEHQLFQLLIKWMEESPSDRKLVAHELANHIRLQGVSPQHLSSTVNPSGLITTQRLLEVYEAHALAGASGKALSVEQSRNAHSLPVWSNTSSHVCTASTEEKWGCGFLQCPPMTSGVHQWSLERVGKRTPSNVAFGVALEGTSTKKIGWLIGQRGTWGFGFNGTVCCEDQDVDHECQPLEIGGRVTLTLNLCPGSAGNGTLTGSIQLEGGETATLGPIKNLLEHLLVQNPHGFVPAVEAFGSAGYRILDYKKVQD